MSTAFPIHRRAALAMAAILIAIGCAASASAAEAACSYPDAAQVFAPWKDKGWYQLAPEGGLEGGGNGWMLEGGAVLIADPGDRNHDGVQEDTALSLPFGSSATSPPVCVDETTPNFRVMLRNFGAKNAKLRVTVTYEGTADPAKARNTDVRAEAEDEWAPSRSLKLETRQEEERVARITFTSEDPDGEYLVDDLYIDPFARH